MSETLKTISPIAICAIICGLAAALGWPFQTLRSHFTTLPSELSTERFLAIKSEIGNVKDPIIIFGDSIVQGASLPRTICAHSIVNAGIVGAGIGYFGRYSKEMLSSARPSLIVLAVGINDATRQGNSNRIETFRSTYESTVKVLLSYAPVALTTISPIKNGSAAGPYDSSLVPELNKTIRATPNVEMLIDVTRPLAEGNLTTDGIHLSAQGYVIWTKAIVEGISRALQCGP
jgi:hypothetical protein